MIEIPNNDPNFVKNLANKRKEKKIDAVLAVLLRQLENDGFQAEYTIDGRFPEDLAKEVARLFLTKGYSAYIFKTRDDAGPECNSRTYLCISRVPKTESESRLVKMICDIGLEEAKKTALKNELRREVEPGKEAWREFWGDSAAVDLAERLEFVYEKDTKKSSVYWNSPSKDIQRSTDLPRVSDYDTEGWTEEYEAWGVKMITKAVEAGCTDATSVENWIRREVDGFHGKYLDSGKDKTPSQESVREFILERCKDCVGYAPMILPEVIAYLECEKTDDWSGWKPTGEAK